MAKNPLAGRIQKNKDEIRLLKNLLAIDASYRATMELSPEKRAEQEIRYRVSSGLNDGQKDELATTFYQKLFEQIRDWFTQNNFVACPLHTWLWVLKELRVDLAHLKPAMCYKLVALNDGATYRWHNKSTEWRGFDRGQAKLRLAYLQKTNLSLIDGKDEGKERKLDATRIFDGEL